jgi:hypothetical protein
MFEYFYHEILRKTVVAFGSLFNDVKIKHVDAQNNTTSFQKVPIAYGPTQKFLARLEQSPDPSKPVQITLPRMSFEYVNLTYDSSRKVTNTQSFLSGLVEDGTQIRKTYMPVPYNMEFELSIMTKLNEDMLQIVEQILPYFQPAYTVTIDLVSQIGEQRDVPIILEGMTMDDSYEGDFATRRALIYKLRFIAKLYLFGPVSGNIDRDIIKKASIGYVSGQRSPLAIKEYAYTVEPRALQSYTDNVVALLALDIDESVGSFTVDDPVYITKESYITIDEEEMYVENVISGTIFVKRGADKTTAAAHVSGSQVKLLTPADDSEIEYGDNFGFND